MASETPVIELMRRLITIILWALGTGICQCEQINEHIPVPILLSTRPHVVNVEGKRLIPPPTNAPVADVFVFLATECPISNGYAPELGRLQAEFSPQGIRFWSVYCDPEETESSIEQHRHAYSMTFPALRDPQQELASFLGISHTPEVAVLTTNGVRIYRGRIDDRHRRLGQSRPQPKARDLHDALESVVHGFPVKEPETDAVGCHLPPRSQ